MILAEHDMRLVKEKTFYNHVLQLVGETGYIPTQRSRIG